MFPDTSIVVSTFQNKYFDPARKTAEEIINNDVCARVIGRYFHSPRAQ